MFLISLVFQLLYSVPKDHEDSPIKQYTITAIFPPTQSSSFTALFRCQWGLWLQYPNWVSKSFLDLCQGAAMYVRAWCILPTPKLIISNTSRQQLYLKVNIQRKCYKERTTLHESCHLERLCVVYILWFFT